MTRHHLCLLAVVCCLLASTSADARPKKPVHSGYPHIHVSVNGKPVEFYSQIMSQAMPALLVRGHAMLPTRFLNEALGMGLDLHLEEWKIVSLSRRGQICSFKIGDNTAYREVDGIGGTRAQPIPLSISPTVINGRLYLPVSDFLWYYQDMTTPNLPTVWNAKTRTLEITMKDFKG